MSASPTLRPQSGDTLPCMIDFWASLTGWNVICAQRNVPIILLKI